MPAIVSLETTLSRNELIVLEKLLQIRKASVEDLAKLCGVPPSTIASIVELLKSKGLVVVEELDVLFAKTSNEGMEYLEKLPEEMLVEVLKLHNGQMPLEQLKTLFGNRLSIAIGWAKRRGWISVEGGMVKLLRYEPLERHRYLLRKFVEEKVVEPDVANDPVFNELVKRKLIIVERRKHRIILLPPGKEDECRRLVESREAVSYLTHELIATGRWRSVKLKPYNVEALPPIVYPGRKHFFKEFIEMIREVMLSLGFVEIRDDYVIPEFWNFDALFQAQDHPSRDIHDVLFVEGSAELSAFKDIVERTRTVHEYGGDTGSRGWGYKWSLEKASKLLLRSHTTAVTIKYLSEHREPPVRAFTIGRVFRRDNIDAKHLPEFTNFDGIIMERDFSFKKLLGLLTQILNALGIKKLRFKPDYFPFTEPSVEGAVYVEGYGWLEVFGAGMFRPEVLRIAGVEHPVGAWGMGIERLALAFLGMNDIRHLYSKDITFIRTFPYSRYLRIFIPR
ncbi:MAG TPA: phenylalanine--tRNA ligase subunit alpha [Ignisphaera aggregans]|uniref:Phenylalanine--tRNA ligase alpha subunit n=1 Tax=Ignisphaera aggregans TaxID=334771 RepID=A0A832YYE2_9CREN|nr:phenylalanine--tRNA ligase subunit alpha [Ignisphaera aggregans]